MRPPNGPIKGGTLASAVSQPLTLELSTTLDLAETSVLDYYAWHVVPHTGELYLVLIGYHFLSDEPGDLRLTVAACITLPPFTDPGVIALASWTTDLGAPSIVRVYRVTPCRNRHALPYDWWRRLVLEIANSTIKIAPVLFTPCWRFRHLIESGGIALCHNRTRLTAPR